MTDLFRVRRLHEHHLDDGATVRHIHEGGAIDHGHGHPGQWRPGRSYSTRPEPPMTPDRRQAWNRVESASVRARLEPGPDTWQARKDAIVHAHDVGLTDAQIARAAGVTRQRIHRLRQTTTGEGSGNDR